MLHPCRNQRQGASRQTTVGQQPVVAVILDLSADRAHGDQIRRRLSAVIQRETAQNDLEQEQDGHPKGCRAPAWESFRMFHEMPKP